MQTGISIASPEFLALCVEYAKCGPPDGDAHDDLVKHADAHAAQRYEAGYYAGKLDMTIELADQYAATLAGKEAAEASLARLVAGVQDVVAWQRPARGHLTDSKNRTEEFVLRADLLALLPAKAGAAPRQALTKMADNEWYFDCEGIYIDVAKDEQGKLSIFVREREGGTEAFLDQNPAPAMGEELPKDDVAVTKWLDENLHSYFSFSGNRDSIMWASTTDIHLFGRACMALRQPGAQELISLQSAAIESHCKSRNEDAATIAELRKALIDLRELHISTLRTPIHFNAYTDIIDKALATPAAPVSQPSAFGVDLPDAEYKKGRSYGILTQDLFTADQLLVTIALLQPLNPPVSQPAGQEAAIAYVPGKWFDARTIDEMQAFYMARLPAIRETAKEHGYAIGLHGTARRDFDLMAMQWRADASGKDTLARAIADAACGIRREGAYDWEKKPNGRVATSIPICWTSHENPDFDNMISAGHIDLSIIEPAPQPDCRWPSCLPEAEQDKLAAEVMTSLTGDAPQPLPSPAGSEQEKAEFDAWYEKRHPSPVHENSTWAHASKMDDWEVWKARAALAAQQKNGGEQ